MIHFSPLQQQPLVVVFSTETLKSPNSINTSKKKKKSINVSVDSDSGSVVAPCRSCSCGRRHFIGSLGASSLLPILPSNASDFKSNSKVMLNEVHPPRADWYEEFYAMAMEKSMRAYEEEIADYKEELFSHLRGKRKQVLEIGIGTGPNLKYYGGGDPDVRVIGVDPNRKMEKYARAAATAAGLPLSQFYFAQAVGEALPVDDASVDAVIGTLVLCSVKDVKTTLEEVKRVLKPGGVYLFIEHVAAPGGTTLRFIQNVADPLQQLVADGCHLTRETGKYISEAGFSDVTLGMTSLSTATLINPHVYGTAYK